MPLINASFAKHNVKTLVNTKVIKIEDHVIFAEGPDGKEIRIEADVIVNALGSKKNVFDVSGITVPTQLIGDCAGERCADIAAAIRSGYFAANEI